MKRRCNISIDTDLWNRAQETYGKGDISKNIERLLRNDLPDTNDKDLSPIDVPTSGRLTSGQEQVVRELIRQGETDLTVEDFVRFCHTNGLYSRKDFIREARQAINRDESIPFTVENGELRAMEIEHECGTSVYVHNLGRRNGDCPGCGVQLVKLEEESSYTIENGS